MHKMQEVLLLKKQNFQLKLLNFQNQKLFSKLQILNNAMQGSHQETGPKKVKKVTFQKKK